MELIDSHCHLDDERFCGRQKDIVASAEKAGIKHFVVPATTRQRWPLLQNLSLSHPNIHVAYGLHPMFMQEHEGFSTEQLEQQLSSHQCVAVGECGLDFFHGQADEKEQITLFDVQLKVAENMGLPCIIHSRKSLDRVISMLRKKRVVGGVVHSFSGSLQQAKQIIDLGFKLGIAATVCFDRAKKLQSVVSRVAIEHIVLESDAPDQAGPDYRGQLNEPLFLLAQLKKVAELQEIDEALVAKATTNNTMELFHLT